MVDDEDFQFLSSFKWCVAIRRNGKAYAQCGTNGKLMHRLIMNPPPGMQVDHINGNSLDNRRSNLRPCTLPENCRNKRKAKNKLGRFKGTCWRSQKRKSQAVIWHNNKQHHLGMFSTEEEAARVYDAEAIRLFGPFACTNFPLA
jgi:hypothetical protein